MTAASVQQPLDAGVRAAYLERLGLEPEPPSADALARLHRRHTECVPYETVWIHAGESWDIDLDAAATRIARDGRGGYCFHLNGAFSMLLGSLGYDVTRHVGGVHGPDGPSGDELANHLVLSVQGLPTDDNPTGRWYVDVGLGDALHEPLPLVAGAYAQGPFHVSLEATPGGVGDWHLTHDPGGSFSGMSWRDRPAAMHEFAEKHEWLSTSPDSGFVKLVSLQRRDATGVDIMRGLVLTRVGTDEAPAEPLTDRAAWFDAVTDVFRLRLDAVPPEALDQLWERTLGAHQRWESGQG